MDHVSRKGAAASGRVFFSGHLQKENAEVNNNNNKERSIRTPCALSCSWGKKGTSATEENERDTGLG